MLTDKLMILFPSSPGVLGASAGTPAARAISSASHNRRWLCRPHPRVRRNCGARNTPSRPGRCAL